MNKSKPIIEEAVKEVYNALQPECLMVADMGCASGRNSFQIIKEIIDIVDGARQGLNLQPPSFGVFLNDRFENDFNILFNLIPSFIKQVEEEKGVGSCFVSVTPKSFYGRVFPDGFLHFVHSSFCLHYLSQVPKELWNEEGELAMNKGSISRTRTSPTKAVEAYSNQFKTDLSEFLRSRAVEMVAGGHMVLTFMGTTNGYHPYNVFDLLGSTLYDLVLEGVIEEEKVDKFNVPFYRPTIEEVKDIVGEVEESHSLFIKKVETFTAEWSIDPTRELEDRVKVVGMYTRAGTETILRDMLGLDQNTLDDLFVRYEKRVKELLVEQICEHFGFVVWIAKKE